MKTLLTTTAIKLSSLLIVATCLFAATGCADESEVGAASLDAPVTQNDLGAQTAPTTCTAGTSRECVIELPSQDGIKNCTVGVQLCEGGKWTSCLDPANVDENLVAAAGVGLP